VERGWFRVAIAALAISFAGCGKDSPADDSEGSDSGSTSTTETGGDSNDSGNETSDSNDTGVNSECSMCEQDCADGQKCVPISLGNDLVPDFLGCTPVDDKTVPVGDDCQIRDYYGAGQDNCEKGAFCVANDFVELTGFCQQTCCPNEQESGCPHGDVCELLLDGIPNVPAVPLCMPGCNPLEPNACDQVGRPDWRCIPTTLGSTCEFFCAPPTPLSEGDEYSDQNGPCLLWTDCKQGLHCQQSQSIVGCDVGFPYCCTAYCDTTDPTTCPDGLECEAFGCPNPEFEDVGACITPQG
jgi:hypothetical protein